MSDELHLLFKNLPDYLGWHMMLSAAALAIGMIVSIPLGIWASRRPVFAEYLLGAAGILQTVPTLALLALMVPVLHAVGFLPAFIALTLYSFLPILANTVTGIRGVDPSLTEAARGLGMSDWQMLRRVQLPLAAPVILSGIRTATVLVVGTATLATPVGGKSLGNYIFSGLNMNDSQAVVFGCIFTAVLAIVLDQLIHLLELAQARRNRRLAWVAAICLVVAIGGALATPIVNAFRPPPIVVASAQFTEQFILSEVIREKLETTGEHVDQRQGMGETIVFLGLKHNQIDCAISYTGDVWATMMKKKEVESPETTYAAVKDFLAREYQIECVGKLGFQNNYVLAMQESEAQRRGITSIGDLAKHPDLVFADDMMFFDRNEWRRILQLYRFDVPATRQTSADPTLLYPMLAKKKVHVITAYSSDGRIKAQNLRELKDPLSAIPKYEAILLLSRRGARNPQLRQALEALRGKISQDAIESANLRVDGGEASPHAAALELLASLR
jgi:osmoprotectant transport system permease protein